MKKILLVSGRYVAENPGRELHLKRYFEERGTKVVFALPGYRLNQNGYSPDFLKQSGWHRLEVKYIDSIDTYRDYLQQVDAVLFGSWKSYRPLVQMARLLGKPTMNFNTTSGLDHWPHDVDAACVKGKFSKRYLLFLNQINQAKGIRSIQAEDVQVVGSLIHEREHDLSDHALEESRASFCKRYQLDLGRPIVALFPKGIESFERKVRTWFPNWSEKRIRAYCSWLTDRYVRICRKVVDANYNLIIKMHPSSYSGYLCDTQREAHFWSRIPGVHTLREEDTQVFYRHVDVGIGINTHSSLDLGYYGKPFVYVDSDQLEPPNLPPFQLQAHCRLAPGPSSKWDNKTSVLNPWFPSWLGYFCGIKDLVQTLDEAVSLNIPEAQHAQFIDEFWHSRDGKVSERIYTAFTNRFEHLESTHRP